MWRWRTDERCDESTDRFSVLGNGEDGLQEGSDGHVPTPVIAAELWLGCGVRRTVVQVAMVRLPDLRDPLR